MSVIIYYQPDVLADDPYGEFQWPDWMAAECEEDRLFGLLPCVCESGWLPLPNGEFTECVECSEAGRWH